jgi:prepilin-type N-terminal cleavage/methylation domain-containing protein
MATDTARRTAPRPRGFTLVEAMVVVAIIAALVGILLPALGILRRNGQLASSQSNMRTIGALMTAYSLDNRDHVLPSQFDYRPAPGAPPRPGLVRTASPSGTNPPTGDLAVGTWSDILWTVGNFGPLMPSLSDQSPSPTWDYRFDSPDYWAYFSEGTVSRNPFRSEVELRKAMPTNTEEAARPFGNGASIREQGMPGYFAANDFFNARPDAAGAPPTGNWYTNAMIRLPMSSLYLIDSRAGETIAPPVRVSDQEPAQWEPASLVAWSPSDPSGGCEVEFRYVGDLCCMLYMDAHVATMGKWASYAELSSARQTRVDRLDRRP